MHRLANCRDTGGNVNVADGDGETPLYTVENIETAQFLLNHGADPAWRNHDGLAVCRVLSNSYSFLTLPLASRYTQGRLSTCGNLSGFTHCVACHGFSGQEM